MFCQQKYFRMTYNRLLCLAYLMLANSLPLLCWWKCYLILLQPNHPTLCCWFSKTVWVHFLLWSEVTNPTGPDQWLHHWLGPSPTLETWLSDYYLHRNVLVSIWGGFTAASCHMGIAFSWSADVSVTHPSVSIGEAALWTLRHALEREKTWGVFSFLFLKYRPHHVQLAIVRCEGWHGIGGQSAGCQRVVGVQGRAVLVVSVGRDGRVEARPEHPQVEGTCERRGRRWDGWLQCGRRWWHFLIWHRDRDWGRVKCELRYILMGRCKDCCKCLCTSKCRFLVSLEFICLEGRYTQLSPAVSECKTRNMTTPFISEKLGEIGWIRRSAFLWLQSS